MSYSREVNLFIVGQINTGATLASADTIPPFKLKSTLFRQDAIMSTAGAGQHRFKVEMVSYPKPKRPTQLRRLNFEYIFQLAPSSC